MTIQKYQTHIGVSLTPPAGWRVDETGAQGAPVLFVSPNLDILENFQFSANLNILVADIDKMNLAQYVLKNKNELFGSLNQYQLIKDEGVEINKQKGWVLEATHNPEGFEIHILQLLIVKNTKGYVLTLNALSKFWDKYEKDFASCIKSVEIK